MIEHLKTAAGKLAERLQYVHENGAENYKTFSINCENLEDFNYVDIRDDEAYFAKFFEELEQLKGPVVYWLEIMNEVDNVKIREHLEAYKVTEEAKNTPALKVSFDPNSRALYVGKVKEKFWGRIIQHLGFYKQKNTQGLQLFYWAKSLGLNLTVHAYEFKPEMAELAGILERQLAFKLNPIIGKH